MNNLCTRTFNFFVLTQEIRTADIATALYQVQETSISCAGSA